MGLSYPNPPPTDRFGPLTMNNIHPDQNTHPVDSEQHMIRLVELYQAAVHHGSQELFLAAYRHGRKMQSQEQIIFVPGLWSPEVYLYHPNNIPKSGWLKEPLAYKFARMAETAGREAEIAFASAYFTRYNQQHPSIDRAPELEHELMTALQARSVVTHLIYHVSGFRELQVRLGRQEKRILLFGERFGGKLPTYRAKQYSAGNHLYHPGNSPFPIANATNATNAEAYNATAYRLFHLAKYEGEAAELAYFSAYLNKHRTPYIVPQSPPRLSPDTVKTIREIVDWPVIPYQLPGQGLITISIGQEVIPLHMKTSAPVRGAAVKG